MIRYFLIFLSKGFTMKAENDREISIGKAIFSGKPES
jgi:hypothetical protein